MSKGKVIGYLVKVDACRVCHAHSHHTFVDVKYKNAAYASWHECTSGYGIFAGGPCCDAIGHVVRGVITNKSPQCTMCGHRIPRHDTPCLVCGMPPQPSGRLRKIRGRKFRA